jgi:hypothetical protein
MPVLAVTLALALSAQADAGAAPPANLLLIAPKKSTPPAERSYELRRAKDGSGDLLYEAPGFTAHIARDGAPRFVDKHFSLIGPWSALKPSPLPQGESSLQGLLFDVLAHRSPRRSQPRDVDPAPGPVPLVPTATPYRPDPREACTYPRPCFFEAAIVVVGAVGMADLTDELMRLAGQDPYRYEKARFLEATSKLRGGLAARALAENIGRAKAELPTRLEAIACDASRSVRERRATIEALRDEMTGDTPAAREAKDTIARFLAERFDGERAVRCPAPAPSP